MVIVYCTEPEVAILEDQVDLQQQDGATWRKQWPPPGRGGAPGVGCSGGGVIMVTVMVVVERTVVAVVKVVVVVVAVTEILKSLICLHRTMIHTELQKEQIF